MKIAELSKGYDRARDELSSQKIKGKGYKEKLRLANNAIKTLSNKVMQYEGERAQMMQGMASVADENRQPNNQRMGGADTHHSSNRVGGSSADAAEIKEAIHKVMQDENLKQQMNRLL